MQVGVTRAHAKVSCLPFVFLPAILKNTLLPHVNIRFPCHLALVFYQLLTTDMLTKLRGIAEAKD